MARGVGGSEEAPAIWRRKRGEEVWKLPALVETKSGQAFKPSEAALKALSKDWRPGFEDDRTSVGGVLRVTFPHAGPLVLLGRARGDLSRLKINGAAAVAFWHGLDAGASPDWPIRPPRGWHPFSLRCPDGPLLSIETGPLRLSLLVAHYTGDPT